MAIDRDRVLARIAYIREQQQAIIELLNARPEAEILGDPWLLRGLKYALQTAVEAMIDIAFHVAAKRFSRAAGDATEALQILADGGVIRRENLATYLAMVGFRNRIVHGYQQVSPERVYAVARDELGDSERFIGEVVAVLDNRQATPNS